MAESLDVQQTSVGVEADLPQRGQIGQPFPDPEIAGVVDGGFGPKSPSLLVVLLGSGVLVIDVQARGDPVGDHPSPEPARCAIRAGGIRRRPKTRVTRSGRPMSRFSRMTCSKKTRPDTGLSSIWVRENSA